MDNRIDVSTLLYDLAKLKNKWEALAGIYGARAWEAYENCCMGDYNKLNNASDSYYACSNELADVLNRRGYPISSETQQKPQ